MPLTLEQYATWLDGRDLPWPAPPKPEPVKARPHLAPLPGVRAVLWNVYGTLLAIPFGELVFEHPQPFVMSMALEKTIAEFKMWASMSRKPGAPSEYMLHLYTTQLDEQRLAPSPARSTPRSWPSGLGGADQEAVSEGLQVRRRVSTARSTSSAGRWRTSSTPACRERPVTPARRGPASRRRCRAGAGSVRRRPVASPPVQIQRGLDAEGDGLRLETVIPPELQVFSCDVKGKKPSERLFRQSPWSGSQSTTSGPPKCCAVGSRIDKDIAPAKKLGMRTALFAGDRTSLAATPSS